MSCCNFDNDILFDKIKDLEKNVKKFEKEQNKTNAEIYTLLKESGVDLSQYYALNEEDYTKVLTSEDDINTLEPGTYKIVEEDMPQNAPKGFAVTPYDGTLIKSNNYMVLYESTGFHFAAGIPIGVNTVWVWYDYAPYAIIKTLLFNYMQIRSYVKFQYDDVHKLTGFAAGVYTVDATVANLPVQTEGLLIIRQGVNKTDNYIVMFLPQNSNDIYKCCKRPNGIWSVWERIAFYSNIPSLDGYATEEWVNEQIQDITGGSVTADWVKANFLAINSNVYIHITQETDITKLQPGTYYCDSNTLTQNTGIPEIVKAKTTFLIVYHCYQYLRFILQDCSTNSFYVINGAATNYYKIASESDIPSLNGYATQEWVQSQNYLTDIPDDYTTDTELTQAITTALIGYATQTWVNQQGFAKETDIPSLSGYATQTWVNQQGFLTEIPKEYITQTELQAQNYATQTWVTGRGYATEQYVNKNYLAIESTLYSDIPENSDLNDYKTVGNYFCSTYVKVRTLKNTPKELKYAFKLTYEEIAANDQAVQKILENSTGNEYIRVKVADNWGEWTKVALMTDIPSLSGYASQKWVQQQGYQTVQQVNSLINTATADMLTQADLDTFNYATENWVLQTALAGYAKTTIDDSLATRPSQEFERFMIRSTDYHGVNAVSGAEGYLVMHMAVDPDAPTKFIRSSGIVVNNKYVNTFSTSDESSVGLATNNEGTVTVVGMSNNAKQMFILVKPDNME